MLKFILPAALVGMLAIGGGGLFMMWNHLGLTEKVMASQAGTEASAAVGETLADLDDATRINLDEPEKMNAFGTALRMVFEGNTGAVTTTPEIDLRGHLPAAPSGWGSFKYETAHGEEIVQQPIKRSMVVQDTTNNVLLDFQRAANAGKRGEARTYLRGQMKMAIRMQVLEQLNTNTVQGGLMADISAQLSAVSFDSGSDNGRTKGLFAKYDGIEIVEQPRWSTHYSQNKKQPVDYRRFIAKLGPYIEIEVITNAADAHVAALLQNIDIAALNAMMPVPAAEFRDGVGWQTASAEPLSDQPPGPSLARRAHAIFNDGRIYSEDDTRILNKIVTGDIEGWNDIARHYGIAYQPSDMMTELLGPLPRSVELARQAGHAKHELSAEFSHVDERIATMLIRMEAQTQGDVIRSSVWRGQHHPEILKLVKSLPMGDFTLEEALTYPAPAAYIRGQEVTMATGSDGAERPTVRRGLDTRGDSARDGSCKIENGVRRCVMTDDES